MQDTAGEAGTNSQVMYSYGPPHMAEQKQEDQHEHAFSNYMRIRDVVQKTCQRRWTKGKSGERGQGYPFYQNDMMMMMMIMIFTNPFAGVGYDKRSIFKRSLTGLNLEFSFSSCLIKAEEHSLSYYLPIAGGRIIGFIPFPRVISAMGNAVSLV